MGKRVQKFYRGTNLDFLTFQQIVNGSYPTKIASEFGMSKSRISYHISSLKERGLIEMDAQALWSVLKNYRPKEYKKTTRVGQSSIKKHLNTFEPDTIRAHAYQFKLHIPKLDNWNNKRRKEVLNKLQIRFKPLEHLFGGGESIRFRGRKVWLTNKSIIVYEKSSYFSETSQQAQTKAVIDVLYLIKALEQKLRIGYKGLTIKGKYQIKVTRAHYSLIKNCLAKIYNKPKRQLLEVSDEKGQWLLIDNSFNLEELEFIRAFDNVEDSQGMKNLMNSYKRTGFKVTPEFIVDTMNGIQQNQMVFAKNIDTHIEAIQNLGFGVKELTQIIKQLQDKK